MVGMEMNTFIPLVEVLWKVWVPLKRAVSCEVLWKVWVPLKRAVYYNIIYGNLTMYIQLYLGK